MTCEDARQMFYAKIRKEMDRGKDLEKISRYLYQCEIMFGKKYYHDRKPSYIPLTYKTFDFVDFLEKTVVDQDGEFAYASSEIPPMVYLLDHYYLRSGKCYKQMVDVKKLKRRQLRSGTCY